MIFAWGRVEDMIFDAAFDALDMGIGKGDVLSRGMIRREFTGRLEMERSRRWGLIGFVYRSPLHVW